MDRRKIMTSVLAIASGSLFLGRSAQADVAPPQSQTLPKVVYHLSDADKVHSVLGNVKNHIKGMGGADKVVIAVVVHGPAVAAFRADSITESVASGTKQLMDEKVAFFACINTLNGMNLNVTDLTPGFGVAEKGGVVKLAELQAQGWAYLRP
jgi:intracellular sulfur oxidation DsrE/DsrF family protein